MLEVSGCGFASISVQQEAGQICLQDKEPNGKYSGHPGSTMGSVCLDIGLLPKLLRRSESNGITVILINLDWSFRVCIKVRQRSS